MLTCPNCSTGLALAMPPQLARAQKAGKTGAKKKPGTNDSGTGGTAAKGQAFGGRKAPPFTDPKSGSTTVSKADAADPAVEKMAKKLIAKGYVSERAYKVATAIIRRGKGAKGGNTPKGSTATAHDGYSAAGSVRPALNLAAARTTPLDDSSSGPKVTSSSARTGRGNTATKLDAQSRRKAADDGVALEDGSFPIRNQKDLDNAVSAMSLTSDAKKPKVRAHIRKRATALGLKVPDAVSGNAA